MLSLPDPCRSLGILPNLPFDVWVDASISVGVGILVNSRWAAWRLLDGWDSDSQDIGWAEAVVIKLAVTWLVSGRSHDATLKIHCDNTSVIHSFYKGRYRNPARNACLLHISSALAVANLTIEPAYVVSAFNKADGLSRGLLGTTDMCLSPPVHLPDALRVFLEPL